MTGPGADGGAVESNIVRLSPRTYAARLIQIYPSGLAISIAGTLDGYIDFALSDANGPQGTYSLTCEDARLLASSLLSIANDVRANCLYDRDILLAGDQP